MMKHVFEQALDINKPWFISKIDFDVKKQRLDVHVSFEAGTQFEYVSEEENIEGMFPVYDTKEKSWRHLNFFQHECHLHCRVPRVKPEDGKIRQTTLSLRSRGRARNSTLKPTL
ncbi:MAG: transposase family protein [Victivallales bacterium]|nr:transposase family protein [Victivallales bacterium]